MTLSVCVSLFVERISEFSKDLSQSGRRNPGMDASTCLQSRAQLHSPSRRSAASFAAFASSLSSVDASPQILSRAAAASFINREPRGTRKWALRRAGAPASASASASRSTSYRSGAASPARRPDLRSPSRGSASRGRLRRGVAAGRCLDGTTAARPPPNPKERMNASLRAMRSSRSISYWLFGGGT